MNVYVMLVDDEYRICNGLAGIIRKKWPDMRIEKFDNGIDALASIRETCPDFLLTDINMPEMNGLELIEKGMALGLRYYAILTGYDEFELVQKALRLQAIDYLMKPVDIPQLYALIEKIMDMRETDERRGMESVQLLLRQYVLLPEEYARILPEAEWPADFRAAEHVCLLVRPDREGDAQGPALSGIRCGDGLDLGEDLHGQRMVLLPVGAGEETALEQDAVKRMEDGNLAGYAMGKRQAETLHELYQRAVEKVPDLLERLAALAESGKPAQEEAARALQDALQRCPDVCARLEIVLDLAYRMHRVWVPWEEMGTLRAFREIRQEEQSAWTWHFLKHLEELACAESPEVCAAMEIVRQNLASDLKPGDVAGLVHMNASYFSALFHRETGMTLVEYINQSRTVRSAVQLLRNPDQSIDQVCTGNGFPNVQYFHRVFKGMTGMTPNAFRQKYV